MVRVLRTWLYLFSSFSAAGTCTDLALACCQHGVAQHRVTSFVRILCSDMTLPDATVIDGGARGFFFF